METSQILSAIKGAKKGIEKQIQNSQNSTNTLLLQILDELMEMNGKKNKLEDKKNILSLNKKYNERNLDKDIKQDKKLEPSDSESKKSEHKEKKKYPADSKREDSSNGKHLRKFTKLIYKKTFSKLVILQIVIITKIFSKFINIFF